MIVVYTSRSVVMPAILVSSTGVSESGKPLRKRTYQEQGDYKRSSYSFQFLHILSNNFLYTTTKITKICVVQ